MNKQTLEKIIAAVLNTATINGNNYYGWINPPVLDSNQTFTHTTGWGENQRQQVVSNAEAAQIFTNKLNGAYGERFVMSIGLIASLLDKGYNVRIVQFQKEPGVPFDAKGWLVIVIETMPMFHISPGDLDTFCIKDIVEVLPDNTSVDVCWKNTNKVGEFYALLLGAVTPGLDLVKIAQEKSG